MQTVGFRSIGVMRSLAFLLSVFFGLVLQGCSAFIAAEGIEPTDLSAVRPGILRQDVEDLLGQPTELETLNGRPAAIYEYDMGRAPGRGGSTTSRDTRDLCQGYVAIVCLFVALGAQPYAINKLYESQKGLLLVVYDTDETILGFTTIPKAGDEEKEARLAKLRAFAKAAEAAKHGNPQDMYEYAIMLNDRRQSWRWYCLAAHGGYYRAQYELGNYYRHGYPPVGQSMVLAYLWYSLSGSEMSWFREHEMSPSEVAEADRLVKEWTPEASECELGAQPQNSGG